MANKHSVKMIRLTDADRVGCKGTAQDSLAIVEKKPTPKTGWTPPSDPEKDFRPDNDPPFSVEVVWDDFKIRLRRNLTESILESVKKGMNAAATAAAGDIEAAIKSAVQVLDPLLSDVLRKFRVSWEFDIDLPKEENKDSHNLYVYQYQKFNVELTKSVPTQKDRFSYETMTDVQVGVPRPELKIFFAGKKKEFEETLSSHAVINLRAGKHKVRTTTYIQLVSDSFRAELQKVIDALKKTLALLSNIDKTLDAYIEKWAKKFATFWSFDSKDEQKTKERARKNEEILENARRQLNELGAKVIELLEDLVKVWTGEVWISSSGFSFNCITAAAADRIENQITQETLIGAKTEKKEEEPKQTPTSETSSPPQSKVGSLPVTRVGSRVELPGNFEAIEEEILERFKAFSAFERRDAVDLMSAALIASEPSLELPELEREVLVTSDELQPLIRPAPSVLRKTSLGAI